MGNSQLPFVNTERPGYEMIQSEEYDIVLSFAGEDRPQAEALAESLRDKGVKAFYDQYEKACLWGKNLYSYLPDLFQNKALYCVMLISQHYATKLWTIL